MAQGVDRTYVAEIIGRPAHGPRKYGRVTMIVEGFELRSDLDGSDEQTFREMVEFALPTARRIRKITRHDGAYADSANG